MHRYSTSDKVKACNKVKQHSNELERLRYMTPKVVQMQVIPVAGHDSMLLNLSGAQGPFFTRNLVILEDNLGYIRVGKS